MCGMDTLQYHILEYYYVFHPHSTHDIYEREPGTGLLRNILEYKILSRQHMVNVLVL
jgi:hypothetical protein